jgi:hypothetical protein
LVIVSGFTLDQLRDQLQRHWSQGRGLGLRSKDSHSYLVVLFISFSAREMTTNKIFTPSPAGVRDPDFLLLLSTVMWQFYRFDTVAAVSVEAHTRSTRSYR